MLNWTSSFLLRAIMIVVLCEAVSVSADYFSMTTYSSESICNETTISYALSFQANICLTSALDLLSVSFSYSCPDGASLAWNTTQNCSSADLPLSTVYSSCAGKCSPDRSPYPSKAPLFTFEYHGPAPGATICGTVPGLSVLGPVRSVGLFYQTCVPGRINATKYDVFDTYVDELTCSNTTCDQCTFARRYNGTSLTQLAFASLVVSISPHLCSPFEKMVLAILISIKGLGSSS